MNLIKPFFNKYFELAFWVTGLICLAMANPNAAIHFTLCPLKLLGIKWCPGCGLGHAISFLFHGDISSSVRAHWLGIPALIIILHRIFILGKRCFFHGPNLLTAVLAGFNISTNSTG